jgi:hypothetical protein
MLPNRHNRPMAHVRQLRDSLPEGPKEAQRQTRTARSSFVAMHQCVEYSPTASSSSSSSSPGMFSPCHCPCSSSSSSLGSSAKAPRSFCPRYLSVCLSVCLSPWRSTRTTFSLFSSVCWICFLHWSAARCTKGCGFLFFVFFLSVSLSLSFSLSLSLSLSLSPVSVPVYISLSLRLVCLSLSVSVYLSICLCACLPACLSVSL